MRRRKKREGREYLMSPGQDAFSLREFSCLAVVRISLLSNIADKARISRGHAHPPKHLDGIGWTRAERGEEFRAQTSVCTLYKQ